MNNDNGGPVERAVLPIVGEDGDYVSTLALARLIGVEHDELRRSAMSVVEGYSCADWPELHLDEDQAMSILKCNGITSGYCFDTVKATFDKVYTDRGHRENARHVVGNVVESKIVEVDCDSEHTSSVEFAEYTGQDHDYVKTVVEAQFERLCDLDPVRKDDVQYYFTNNQLKFMVSIAPLTETTISIKHSQAMDSKFTLRQMMRYMFEYSRKDGDKPMDKDELDDICRQ